MSATHAQPRRSAAIAWVLAGLAVLLVSLAVWAAVQLAAAGRELQAAKGALGSIGQLIQQDPAAASSALADAGDHLAQANELARVPVVRLMEVLPLVGPQVHAIRTVSAALDSGVNDGIVPLLTAGTADLSALTPHDGHFDLAAISAVAAPARSASDALAQASAAVDALQPAELLTPIASAVVEADSALGTAHGVADSVANAAELLPGMLGADGPRDTLLLFQNNAEWRSLGGVASSLALVRAEGGAVSLIDQAASTDFPTYQEPVLPISDEHYAVFGAKPGRWIQNVTQIPDFTVGAPLAREMWQRERGGTVSAVLAVDPVMLSYVLEATGPILLDSGDTISSDNAVQLLLSDVYQRYTNPADQDAFFASTAAAVFNRLAAGSVDSSKLLSALARAGAERRVLVWSTNDREQQLIETTTLAGQISPSTAQSTNIGVYLNDGTGSKMDSFLHADSSAKWTATGLVSTVTLSNTAPTDAGAVLPEYVTGGPATGLPAGTARTVVYLYVPRSFQIVDARATVEQTQAASVVGEHTVVTWIVDLAPGQSAEFTVQASGTPTAAITVEMTPTIPR